MPNSNSIEFTKYCGAGNDFILVDDRKGQFAGDVSVLCDRCYGVGADGVILLGRDLRMRIFNADGGEVQMCGNGLRCLGRFASDLGLGSDLRVQTAAGTLRVQVSELVTAQLPSPAGTFPLINTGVPHYLTRVDEIDEAPVQTLGRELRWEHNANATFFAVDGERLFCRTYERGVEGETLACGTGAAAAALASGLSGTIEVVVRSGESLWIDTDPLCMTGPARRTFCGRFHCGNMLAC